jgi:hypothetical protein
MTGFLVGLSAFLAHLILSLLWLWRPGGIAPVTRHIISALSTHAAATVFGVVFVGNVDCWVITAVSGFGAVSWLFIYSAVYKSVSLRILTKLTKQIRGRMLFDMITATEVRPEFEARADLLVRMGYVVQHSSHYELTNRGSNVARWIRLIQRAYGIKSSGLYTSPLSQAQSFCCTIQAPSSPIP